MTLLALGTRRPQIDPSAYVAPGAQLLGGVILRSQASVWFNAVLRGDNEDIELQEGANVQDGAVLHTDMGSPLRIGRRVSVGHQAMLHGCIIGEGSLIGMQAIILNGAQIGAHCLIGAGALITSGVVIPERSLVIGRPGKVVRLLTDEEFASLDRTAQGYIDRARVYAQTCKPVHE